MLRQHPRGKNSRIVANPERAMSLVKQSSHLRNRSQEPPPGSSASSNDRSADLDISGQSSQGQLALVWSREPATPSRTSAAMTRFAAAAAARVAGYAGGDVLHIFLAIASWILWEFFHGCAAYAQAMYPPIDPTDREFAKSEAARPVAPAQPGRDATIAAGKPRLTLAASNEHVITKYQSERQ
jgi:hypothetical protein